LQSEEPAAQPAEPRRARQATLADLNCCTYCHAAGKPLARRDRDASEKSPHGDAASKTASKALSARLQTSCQLCHASAQVSATFSSMRVQ
jgi:hypothetical protein